MERYEIMLEDELEHNHHFHSLVGGMGSDYFNIFCKKCGVAIEYLNYYGIDSVGVRLVAKCGICNEESIFKLKVFPPLGPIEITDNYNKRGYTLYDGRKLRKYFRSIGHISHIFRKESSIKK